MLTDHGLLCKTGLYPVHISRVTRAVSRGSTLRLIILMTVFRMQSARMMPNSRVLTSTSSPDFRAKRQQSAGNQQRRATASNGDLIVSQS